jgi:beta-glucosidase
LEQSGEITKHGKENFISGAGVGHWTRYPEDISLAASLSMNALRISLEWSKIEPAEGQFSEDALAHYVDVIRTMRANGIEPFVTLWHWPLPLWLADRGGWESKKTAESFARFTKKVLEVLGKDVRYWITLNEPEIYSTHSYMQGLWPPQKKNPIALLAVVRNLVAGHRTAYAVIKKIRPDAMVGIAKNNIWFEAANDSLWNRLVAGCGTFFWNDLILRLVDSTSDFVGINHYFHNRVDGWFNRNKNERVSDLGWELRQNIKNRSSSPRMVLRTRRIRNASGFWRSHFRGSQRHPQMARMCAAICTGRSWITSSGRTGIGRSSG